MPRLALAVLVILAASTCDAVGSDYSLWLRANPQAIVADSYSTTTITAEVRDMSGRAVPDGTIVDFTTSLGTIERSARTAAGIARVRLQSDTTIGTATISALVTAGNAVGQLRVDFLEQGTELFDESFISVSSGKHLGYDVGGQVVDSAGGVRILNRGLTIDAEEAQIDVKNNILRAKGVGDKRILIRGGERKLWASALYYDFSRMSGAILTPAEDGARRMRFRGRDLRIEPDDDPQKNVTFDFEPVSECTMFIKARSLIIRPGEEIKFKRAVFYLDGSRVLSVPLYVASLKGANGSPNRMLTYGTEGLLLNLPFYYSLTPNASGAVRLKRSEPNGWGSYQGQSGWQVDLEQEYTSGGSTEGAFTVDRVTSRDWGLQWNHRQDFDDDSRMYTYFDFPGHRDLYGNFDYSRPLEDYTMSFNFQGSRLRDASTRFSTNAYLQSRPRPLIGDAVKYAFSSRLSYFGVSTSGVGGLGTGAGLQLYGKPVQLGHGSSLSTSLNVTRDWGGTRDGTSIYANAGYFRNLGDIGQLSLNYSYSWSNSFYGYGAQRLSADLYLRPSKRWNAHVYASHGLDDASLSAFGDLSLALMPTWRLSLLGTYQKQRYFSYTDSEYALGKMIGGQEARLIWSQSRKRFRMEFSALSF